MTRLADCPRCDTMKNTDNMRVDDEQWRQLMRRYFVLTDPNAPEEWRAEMAAIDEALHQCELRHVRGSIAPLVDDALEADEALRNAGNLDTEEI